MIDKKLIDMEPIYSKKISLIQNSILRFCKSKIYNVSDAHDVCQNVLFILSNKQSSYDSKKSFYAWAFKICRFQILRYLTEKKRFNKKISDDSFLSFINSVDDLCPLSLAIESECKKERSDLVNKITLKLPPRQKTLIKHSLSGKSKKEIMQIMSISSNNYNAIKSRAISLFKLNLKYE